MLCQKGSIHIGCQNECWLLRMVPGPIFKHPCKRHSIWILQLWIHDIHCGYQHLYWHLSLCVTVCMTRSGSSIAIFPKCQSEQPSFTLTWIQRIRWIMIDHWSKNWAQFGDPDTHMLTCWWCANILVSYARVGRLEPFYYNDKCFLPGNSANASDSIRRNSIMHLAYFLCFSSYISVFSTNSMTYIFQ